MEKNPPTKKETIIRQTRIVITKTEERKSTQQKGGTHGIKIERVFATDISGQTFHTHSIENQSPTSTLLATFEFSISTDAQLEMILRSMLSELGLK